MAGFIGMGENQECRALRASDMAGSSDGPITISASVGMRGANLATDVLTIQQALNNVPFDQGQPLPLLDEDGICGPKTKNAIQNFQLKHFGWPGADGRVDPGQQTIAKLNELAGASMALSPAELEAARVARVIASINEALRCVTAAQANLLAASLAVDQPANAPSLLPSFSREARMLLANRHFDIDTYPADQRGPVLGEVLQVYDIMRQVFQRPGGLWGPQVFAPDKRGEKKFIAFTFGGGFFHSGESQDEQGVNVRFDAIYLCRRLDGQIGEVPVIVILHELAHFVSRADTIIDHAYGWYTRPRMQALTPLKKKNNAQNYANFAFDAANGRQPIGL